MNKQEQKTIIREVKILQDKIDNLEINECISEEMKEMIQVEKLDKGYRVTIYTAKNDRIIKRDWLKSNATGVHSLLDAFFIG